MKMPGTLASVVRVRGASEVLQPEKTAGRDFLEGAETWTTL
jgi:hypothetical protein